MIAIFLAIAFIAFTTPLIIGLIDYNLLDSLLFDILPNSEDLFRAGFEIVKMLTGNG